MAGSIRLKRGSNVWELRVYLGRDREGKVCHRSVTFHGARRAAERELARLVADHDTTTPPVTEPRTEWGARSMVNDAIAAWRDNGWEDLSPKTARGHDEIWNRYIRDSIGSRRIAELSPYDVERFFRDLKRAGAGMHTVRRVKSVLHRACRLAARWSGGELANPVANTELPTWSFAETAEPVRAPTPEEVVRLVEAAADFGLRHGAFVRLVAATGMRRAEASALRWSDLDVQAGTVRIDEAVVAGSGGAVVKSPKTRASIRTVALDTGSFARLSELQVEQRSLARACGFDLPHDAFVFSAEPGGRTPPHPEAMTHAFTRIRDRAGVATDVHLHSLRHFHATVLDPVVSESQKQARLGWSTARMARHYTGSVPEEDRRAADYVGGILGQDRPRL